MLKFNLKKTLPRLTSSMCIRQFTCSCKVQYIDCTTRQLHKRIGEHYPVRLVKGTIGTIRSSILKHPMSSKYVINSERAFKIFYRTRVNENHSTRLKHLNMAEAILINFYTPELCSRKKPFHNILLPWPSLFR